MIPAPFEYHAPKTLSEATKLLAQLGGDGKILAGGHSLVPLMKLRLAAPKHVIDIGRVGDLKYIRADNGKLQVGALTTHYEIESSELLKAECPLLPETAGEIGDVQVRNKGTIGGNLAHADPAADWPAAILALGAELQATSVRAERWIPAKEFFVDLLTTSLEPDEILTAIRVPSLPRAAAQEGQSAPRAGDAYLKVPQPASGFAIVGVAVRVVLNEERKIVEDVGIGITGVGPKAYRAVAAEAVLRGKSPSAQRLAEAAAHAAEGVDANSDLYASAEYRAHLASVYARRALELAVQRASGA